MRLARKLLTMDILYFDVETTGLDPAEDRIIEIGMVLQDAQGKELADYTTLVHPGRSIPAEVTAIHGLRDEDVRNAPSFAQVAPAIEKLVSRAGGLAGYNVGFDLRMLRQEFLRSGMFLSISGKRILDMQKIYFHHQPRDLKAAYKFYCEGELTDGHRAMNDVRATMAVFAAQKRRYTIDLADRKGSGYAELNPPIDSNGAFEFNENGEVVLAFGKFKGRAARPKEPEMRNYLSWMIGAGFPSDTKNIARTLSAGNIVTRENAEQVARGR